MCCNFFRRVCVPFTRTYVYAAALGSRVVRCNTFGVHLVHGKTRRRDATRCGVPAACTADRVCKSRWVASDEVWCRVVSCRVTRGLNCRDKLSWQEVYLPVPGLHWIQRLPCAMMALLNSYRSRRVCNTCMRRRAPRIDKKMGDRGPGRGNFVVQDAAGAEHALPAGPHRGDRAASLRRL